MGLRIKDLMVRLISVVASVDDYAQVFEEIAQLNLLFKCCSSNESCISCKNITNSLFLIHV